MKPYVSIDIETTGLNPESCQILEIGAVIDDFESPISALPTFHCYVDHGFYHGEPFALQLNALILGRLARIEENKQFFSFLKPTGVAEEFACFLTRNKIDSRRVPCAGKNFASFDKRFLEKLPYWSNWIKLNHRTLDPAILFLDFDKDDGIPDTKTCMERAGILGEVAHTAVEDALTVVQLVRKAREISNALHF